MYGLLNVRLEITVLILVEIYRNFSKCSNKVYRFCCEDKPGLMKRKDLAFLVREKIQDLVQQG